jgi:hypothetical protein
MLVTPSRAEAQAREGERSNFSLKRSGATLCAKQVFPDQ